MFQVGAPRPSVTVGAPRPSITVGAPKPSVTGSVTGLETKTRVKDYYCGWGNVTGKCTETKCFR